jgi:lipid II:glycine glycyltransferase (peptidoglycan interpeptide bridge formation enzyme)
LEVSVLPEPLSPEIRMHWPRCSCSKEWKELSLMAKLKTKNIGLVIWFRKENRWFFSIKSYLKKACFLAKVCVPDWNEWVWGSGWDPFQKNYNTLQNFMNSLTEFSTVCKNLTWNLVEIREIHSPIPKILRRVI